LLMDFEAVTETNDDAAFCKLSAVNLGYWHDPFVKHFVNRPSRVSPLMNRGYYTRVTAVQSIISKFLESGGKQIISLGAGFDTTFFQLKSKGAQPTTYIEIDLPQVTRKKTLLIKKTPELKSLLEATEEVTYGTYEVLSPSYSLLGLDLRSVQSLDQRLNNLPSFKKTEKTLVLSECVLIYLLPSHSSAIFEWIDKTFSSTSVFVAVYEQILPDDPFGKIMCLNLEQRGCALYGIKEYPDLVSQKKRFESLGWENVVAYDMKTISDKLLTPSELARLKNIEMFDEIEEWNLIQAHYCIVVATNDPQHENFLKSIFG